MLLAGALLSLVLTGSIEPHVPTHPNINAMEQPQEAPTLCCVYFFVISEDTSARRSCVLIFWSQAKYDPYGKVTILAADGVTVRTASAIGNEITYTGRRRDAETGLYYFRNRYYSGDLGRFVSRDPLNYVDGMSMYHGYFAVNGVDPFGLDDQWHHLIPQQVKKYLEEKGFDWSKIGLDLHHPDNGWILDESWHTGKGGLHSKDWNGDWKKQIDDWIRNGDTITGNMLNKYKDELMKSDKYKDIIAQGCKAKVGYKEWKCILAWLSRKARKIASAAAGVATKNIGRKGKAIAGVGLIFIGAVAGSAYAEEGANWVAPNTVNKYKQGGNIYDLSKEAAWDTIENYNNGALECISGAGELFQQKPYRLIFGEDDKVNPDADW